jgi:aryl-alcohol dehydrogenase-like predicted oxidoreductase
MEYRRLGSSGFKVPVLSLGTGTFGGKGMLKSWGGSDVKEARGLIDICLEAGLNMFDSANVYSSGAAEEVLGGAIKGLSREDLIISTKATFRSGARPNDVGSSRYHLTQTIEGSLKRLGTDYIDLFQLHGFDAQTPVEEVLSTLNDFVHAGKIRYVGCSNFSGWQLMKSLAASDRYGWARYVAHQAYYSLIGRDYEWELMPLALDQGVGAVVWSPLGWGRLTGKIRRGQPLPKVSRLHETAAFGPPVDDERLYMAVDALEAVAGEVGKTVPQVALNWLLQPGRASRPSSSARATRRSLRTISARSAGLSPPNRSRSSTPPPLSPPPIRTGTKPSSWSAIRSRFEVRTALYMAALVASRAPHYQKFRASEKATKQALTACIRKVLAILSAIIRDRKRWLLNP